MANATHTIIPKYVFDSGPFIQLSNYPRDIFPGLWGNLEDLMNQGHVTSVSEVFREITNYDDEIAKWAKVMPHSFPRPSPEEQQAATSILNNHPYLIKQSDLLAGKPVADPFVIAKAQISACCVVSSEKYKPNAHKIPNVCEKLNVEHCDLFEFFRKEKWRF